MKVTFEGWERNHGRHEVISEELENTVVSDVSPSPSFKKGKLYIEHDEDGSAKTVLYTRGVYVKLGGNYQLRIVLTPADILLLAYLCFQGLSMSAFTRAFSALSEVGEKLNRARVTLSRGYSNWHTDLPRVPRLPSPPQH